MMAAYKEYTAFFSYTIVDSHEKIINIENNYGGAVNYNSGAYESHSNHSKSFVDKKFSAHSLARQKAADDFVSNASVATTEAEVRKVLESKPLWKGRGKMMGTVTSTYFTVNDKKVDMYVKTDSKHPVVHNQPTNGSISMGIADKTGSIQACKSADFIVLQEDLFEISKFDIHKTKVQSTVFRGKKVYRSA